MPHRIQSPTRVRRRARRFAWRRVGMVVALTAVLAGSLAHPASAAQDGRPAKATVRRGNGLFVSAKVHDVAVTIDQDEYEAMLDAYSETGEKEWISADIEIDGMKYRDVGMRLKGNSSLAGLRGGGAGRQVPAGAADARGGPGGSASADEPSSLPWLVELDHFVDDQSHRGVEEFVIRSSSSETALNEAVALELLSAAGLASQKAAPVSLSVNGGDERLRLVIEHPNDEWDAESFDHDGVLYKAESTGDYSYRGDDVSAYEEVFDQETDKDDENYEPLTKFLAFINNSDDATFAADLDEYLDVESFARYLAFEDLIDNFDDISGPGNNSYLRYDEETGQMTVVAWDHNLAFGGLGGFGRQTAGGPAGNQDGAFTPPEGFDPTRIPEGFDPTRIPEGLDPTQIPEGLGQGAPIGGGGRGAFGRSNILVSRFESTEQLATRYDAATEQLRDELFTSGKAQKILDRWVKVLKAHATDLVDQATIDSEAAAISAYFAT